MTIVEATLVLIVAMMASLMLSIGAIFGSGGPVMIMVALICMCLAPVAFMSFLFLGTWRSRENLWRPDGSGKPFQVMMTTLIALCAAGAITSIV